MSNLLQQAVTAYRGGDLERAHELVCAALEVDLLDGDAWHLRGVLALNAQQFANAVDHFRQAATIKKNDPGILVNYAAALNTTSKFSEALQVLSDAIPLNPQFAEAHYQLGSSHLGLMNLPQASAAFTEAVRLKPDWPDALAILAHVLAQTGEFEKAMEHALRALESEPDRPICHRIVGDVCMRLFNYKEALVRYQRAVELAPRDGLVRNNYALLLARMGRDAESLIEYREAVTLTPGSSQAREGYAGALLKAGRLAEGWPDHVARYKPSGPGFAARKGAPPPTDPSQLKGKSVLAWLDQGVGDQIMFASLIPDLIATGAEITIESDSRLTPILRRSFPQIATRAGVEGPLIPFDSSPLPGDDQFSHQLFLTDTAQWFRPDFAAFPRHRGYLKADPELTQRLRQSYRRKYGNRPLIGISWRTANNAKVSTQKTLQLAEWGPLLVGREATFVSLQYGDLHREIANVTRKLKTTIVEDSTIDPVADLDSFASQVAAMDLVITTSNATAHMAGSLNVPVWTLVPKGFGAMWHWFLDRDDSPWYPSMRLLRQSAQGNWGSALGSASIMLGAFIMSWRE